MKKVSFIAVILFLLVVGFVSAEQGELEIGLGGSGFNGILPLFYGEYFITDRIEISLVLGYCIDEYSDIVVSASDKYLFGASIGYDVLKSERRDLILGIDGGHYNYINKYEKGWLGFNSEKGKTGWNISALIKYSFNFKSGFILGLGGTFGLLYDTYEIDYYGSKVTEFKSEQSYFGFDLRFGWKFRIRKDKG